MAESSFTVSLVEDEPVLRQELAFQLRHFGFDVEAFESAPGFYRYLAQRPRTVAVLDIGLSGEDGLSICRYLRQHDAQMGIVFVTARGLRDDRLTGLASGADAYLVKPIDIEELVLVIRRLGARYEAAADKEAGAPPSLSGWKLEGRGGFLVAPDASRIRLSVNEIQLMQVLLGRGGSLCRHAELAQAMGFSLDEVERHRLEVIVSRLRSKVERESGLTLPLRAVRGQGYVLEP